MLQNRYKNEHKRRVIKFNINTHKNNVIKQVTLEGRSITYNDNHKDMQAIHSKSHA